MAKKSFNPEEQLRGMFTAPEAQETQSTQETQEKHDIPEIAKTQAVLDALGISDDEGLQEFRSSLTTLNKLAKQINPNQGKRGRPKKEKPLRGYRYGLNLDADLDPYLHEIIWKKRTTMTQYINDLIRADYEAYLADCKKKGIDPYEGWEQRPDNV